MTWRDRYRQASYAGASFLIDSHEFSGGRVGVVHSYPQRDAPFVEDTGREPRRFVVRGYILGDDYDLDRDRLVEKLETRSPGFPNKIGRALSHPYLGLLTVFATGYSVRETTSEGRLCRVTMSFVEVPETEVPSRKRSNTAAADKAAEELDDAAAAGAEAAITTSGVPESVRLATSRTSSEIGAALSNLDVFRTASQDVAAYADLATQLSSQALSLAVSPATLVSTVRNAIESIFEIAGSPSAALAAYEALFDFETTKATGTSSNARKAATNATALEELTLQLALSGAIRAAVRVDWEYLGEALAARDALLAQLDELAGCSSSDVCLLLPELLAVLTESVPNPDEDIPRLQTIELSTWEPAILTAWRLYADPSRADEIARRNLVPRAGFLPALTPLEVLVDG